MAKPSLLSVCLCFLVLFHCCVADWQQGSQQQRQRQRGSQQQQQQGECQIQRLNAQEPQQRIEAEAGVTEFWDYTDDQFQCAGVAVCRNTINPQGLLLPAYTNAPALVYVAQGRGYQGVMMPGCPETFQSSQQPQEGQSRRFQDQHQQIRHFREGDIIALPAGVAHWCYNDGDRDLVLVIMEDTSNNHNQLDNNPRKFYLAGNPQQSQQQQQRGVYGPRPGEQHNSGNIFNGIDLETLVEAFGVDRETARKLQGEDDKRGHIIRVERDLQVIRPPTTREEQERQERRQYRGRDNGLEETICSARIRENIDDPSRADIFNPRAGRLSTLNSFNLPILRFLQLSAERGVLYRNAIMAPHWKLNAHTVLYATRGEAQVQIVDHRGQSVFNDRIREGQLVVVPQNFVVVKQAGNEGFEWVAMKTNDNAMYSTLAGRTSVLRAMPLDVLANAYQISRDEARRLKQRRDEAVLFEPSSRSQSERRAPA